MSIYLCNHTWYVLSLHYYRPLWFLIAFRARVAHVIFQKYLAAGRGGGPPLPNWSPRDALCASLTSILYYSKFEPPLPTSWIRPWIWNLALRARFQICDRFPRVFSIATETVKNQCLSLKQYMYCYCYYTKQPDVLSRIQIHVMSCQILYWFLFSRQSHQTGEQNRPNAKFQVRYDGDETFHDLINLYHGRIPGHHTVTCTCRGHQLQATGTWHHCVVDSSSQ